MKIIVLLSISLLLVGCVKNNFEQMQNNVGDQISGPPETLERSLAESLSDIEGDLCYIKDIFAKDSRTFVKIDRLEWFSFNDNTCSTSPEVKAGMPQCNPNGFLIQNSSQDFETYEVWPSASVLSEIFGTNSSAIVKISLWDFNKLFVSQREYFGFTPFLVKIENGIITAIQQKYVP